MAESDAVVYFKRFEPALEARFQRDLEPEKVLMARHGSALAVVLNLAFVGIDFWALPLSFASAFPTRMLLVAFSLGLFFYSRQPHFARHYDFVVTAFLLLLGFALEMIVFTAQPGEVARLYGFAVLLVVAGMFGLSFLGRRVEHAIAASLLALHLVVSVYAHQARTATEITAIVTFSAIFLGFWMVCALSQSGRERHARLSFLRKCGLESELHSELRARQVVEELANADPLTGLANRRHFEATLAMMTRDARRTGSLVTVLFIDLDRFKEVNDRHGHAVGDGILRSIAQRIRASLDERDCVARYGGDEFVVASAVSAEMHGDQIADRIRTCFLAPVIEGAASAQLGASIGYAVFPRDGETASELIAAADRRMYRVKGPCAPRDPATVH